MIYIPGRPPGIFYAFKPSALHLKYKKSHAHNNVGVLFSLKEQP